MRAWDVHSCGQADRGRGWREAGAAPASAAGWPPELSKPSLASPLYSRAPAHAGAGMGGDVSGGCVAVHSAPTCGAAALSCVRASTTASTVPEESATRSTLLTTSRSATATCFSASCRLRVNAKAPVGRRWRNTWQASTTVTTPSRPRVGQTAHLDDDVVKRQTDATGCRGRLAISPLAVAAAAGTATRARVTDPSHLEKLVQHALQLRARCLSRAAHAPILQDHHTRRCRSLLGLVDERVIDRDGAELVLDDEDASPVVAGKNSVH
eukprot:scaffold22513_cov107-Isochrysis_galbana.AAC.1